jgi:hypothetical protein
VARRAPSRQRPRRRSRLAAPFPRATSRPSVSPTSSASAVSRRIATATSSPRSYMRNAPKEDAFPIEKVNDDQGNERQALKLDAGIEWWERKNKRAAERKENAAAKAAKKAEKAAATSEAEGSDETGPTEEAE